MSTEKRFWEARRACASSASTPSSTTLPPRSSSTARSSPPPRRSASAAASTARSRCRSRPGSCPSRRRAGAWRGRARRRATSTPSPTPTTRRWPRRPAPTSPPTSGRGCARSSPQRAPRFLATALPGLDPGDVRFVAHHVAHAASADLASPHRRLRRARARRPRRAAPRTSPAATADGTLEVLAAQELPHSLGLLYEELTEHLGFRRSSDEYKVMAMASYGEPAFLDDAARARARRRRRRLRDRALDWARFAPRLAPGEELDRRARRPRVLACSGALEEVLLELARWLHERTGDARARRWPAASR